MDNLNRPRQNDALPNDIRQNAKPIGTRYRDPNEKDDHAGDQKRRRQPDRGQKRPVKCPNSAKDPANTIHESSRQQGRQKMHRRAKDWRHLRRDRPVWSSGGLSDGFRDRQQPFDNTRNCSQQSRALYQHDARHRPFQDSPERLGRFEESIPKKMEHIAPLIAAASHDAVRPQIHRQKDACHTNRRNNRKNVSCLGKPMNLGKTDGDEPNKCKHRDPVRHRSYPDTA